MRFPHSPLFHCHRGLPAIDDVSPSFPLSSDDSFADLVGTISVAHLAQTNLFSFQSSFFFVPRRMTAALS